MVSLSTDPNNPQNPLGNPAVSPIFKAQELEARSIGYTRRTVNISQTLPDAGKDLWDRCETGSYPVKFRRHRFGLSRWHKATLECGSNAPASPFIKASAILVRRFQDLSGPVAPKLE